MRFMNLRHIFALGVSRADAPEDQGQSESLALEDVKMFSSKPIGRHMVLEEGQSAKWQATHIRALRVSSYKGMSTSFKLTVHTADAVDKDGKITHGQLDIQQIPGQGQLSFRQAIEYIQAWEAERLGRSGHFTDKRKLNMPHVSEIAPLYEEFSGAYKQTAKARFRLV